MAKHPLSRLLYEIGAGAYFAGIGLASSFHPKARLMTRGRRETLARIRERRKPGDRYLWLHASSLGEFEQGRPLIEAVKKEHPEIKVCLTFFSPSGYEVRKNYAGADIVAYLPFDTSSDLRAFLDLLAPEMAIFVKYEFWLNALSLLRERGIPTYLISAKFRPSQPFFKPWGGLFREALKGFTEIFVQEKGSLDLLRSIGIDRVTVAGDTRADRVIEIAEHAEKLPIVEAFAIEKPVLVVGSSWDKDEERYLPFLKEHRGELLTIIAPHEVHEERIVSLLESLKPLKAHRYTKGVPPEGTEVLVIDRIGILSSVYAYGTIAYIGGGFGAGIHNTLEPAVYGLPVLFGPKYGKFAEALSLLERGGAYSIETAEELSEILGRLLSDPAFCQRASREARDFVRESAGATRLILSRLFPPLP